MDAWVGFHALRHTCSTALVRAGLSRPSDVGIAYIGQEAES